MIDILTMHMPLKDEVLTRSRSKVVVIRRPLVGSFVGYEYILMLKKNRIRGGLEVRATFSY